LPAARNRRLLRRLERRPPLLRLRSWGSWSERYWAEAAALTPWYAWGGADIPFGETPVENIAPQSLADSLAIERRYLASVSTVPRPSLDAQSKLTYDIFARGRSLTVEGFTYPLELMPINPYRACPRRLPLSASGAERLAISSAEEYEHWRTRALRFVEWTNQAIVNMRAGLRRGYTVPRILIGERSRTRRAGRRRTGQCVL